MDDLLNHTSDDFWKDVFSDVKSRYGIEQACTDALEDHSRMQKDEASPPRHDEPGPAAGEDWWSQQPSNLPASWRDSYDQYEDVLDRIQQYGKDQEHGFGENWDLFWWRARNQGWTEEQARTVWKQIERERATYELLHDPWVQIGLSLTGAAGAFAAFRAALAGRTAAQIAGNSRLVTLWNRFADYFRSQGLSVETKGGASFSEAAEVRATISRTKHPEAARHVEDAQVAGQPSELTIDRAGARTRGREALRDTPTRPGRDRDEYPPKMFEEGGEGASVRHILPADNRGAGASVGNQLRKHTNGTKVKIEVID